MCVATKMLFFPFHLSSLVSIKLSTHTPPHTLNVYLHVWDKKKTIVTIFHKKGLPISPDTCKNPRIIIIHIVYLPARCGTSDFFFLYKAANKAWVVPRRWVGRFGRCFPCRATFEGVGRAGVEEFRDSGDSCESHSTVPPESLEQWFPNAKLPGSLQF